jgi:O-antigen ligase
MTRFLTQPLSLLLTLYIASLIVFKQNYFTVTYFVNAALVGYFLFRMFQMREKKYHVNTVVALYALFVVMSAASSFWAVDPDLALYRSLQLFLILINLVVLYNVIHKFDLENAFLNGILLGAFVNFILMLNIIQPPFDVYVFGRAMGTLGNPNVLAIVMIMSIFSSMVYLTKEHEISKPFFYYQYLNILLSSYLIFLTVSKKGILFGSILILAFVLLSLKRPKDLFRLSILGSIALVVMVNVIGTDEILGVADSIIKRFSDFESGLANPSRFGSTGERMYFIKLGLSLFTERPLFGYGLDNFRVFGGTYSHNNFVELLTDLGLVGFSIYYAIYLHLLNKAFWFVKDRLIYILITFVLIILVMGIAFVAYDDKLTTFSLLFVAILLEQKRREALKAGEHEN